MHLSASISNEPSCMKGCQEASLCFMLYKSAEGCNFAAQQSMICSTDNGLRSESFPSKAANRQASTHPSIHPTGKLYD